MREFFTALQIPNLEPMTDFFAAGGDSLSAASVANTLGISALLLYGFPSARKLAAHLALNAAQSPLASPRLPISFGGAYNQLESGVAAMRYELSRAESVCGSSAVQRLEVPPVSPAFDASDSFSRAFLNPTLPACILSSAGRVHYLPPRDSPPSGHRQTHRGYDGTLNESTLTLLAPAASQRGDDALSGHSTPPYQMGNLRCVWRVPLHDCVDAAPVVVLQLDDQCGPHPHSSTSPAP